MASGRSTGDLNHTFISYEINKREIFELKKF